MRRFVGVLVLICVGSLGLGAAFVLAGSEQHNGITICHATGTPGHFVVDHPDADSILAEHGHGGHANDIIPPFVVIDNGVRTEFPGLNMNTIYTGGFTGAQVLANGCVIPTGTNPAVTVTVTTTETAIPVTVTAPGTTVTLPAETTTREITVSVTSPGHTVTVPGETTVVTVPTLTTTTVTLPEQTITLPSRTVTAEGETVVLPPVTVTVPGPTQTVTGGATTTVLTITTPAKTISGSQNGPAQVVVTVPTPGRPVTVVGHVVTVIHKGTEKETKVIIVTIHQCRCVTSGIGRG
jgi:hypothetical protein